MIVPQKLKVNNIVLWNTWIDYRVQIEGDLDAQI